MCEVDFVATEERDQRMVRANSLKIPELLELELLEIIQSNPSAKAGSPREGEKETHPGGLEFPERKFPQPLCAASSSALKSLM